MRTFPGFPHKMRFTPIPDLFFTALLPYIDDAAELKTTLHIFWALYHKRGYPRFVTYRELLRDKMLMGGIKEAETLRQSLDLATRRGTILHLALEQDGEQEDLYFLNTESGRMAVGKIQRGELTLGQLTVKGEPYTSEEKPPDIFTLYEQNIGLLTPMIAEELQEAEKLYPPTWVEEAFKEAVVLNKRKWRYIARILERWAAEGKEHGKPGRDSEEAEDSDKYIRGKYGHLVRR